MDCPGILGEETALCLRDGCRSELRGGERALPGLLLPNFSGAGRLLDVKTKQKVEIVQSRTGLPGIAGQGWTEESRRLNSASQDVGSSLAVLGRC